MPDTKVAVLSAISTIDTTLDAIPIVDVSDTTMAISGTTKKISVSQILASGTNVVVPAGTAAAPSISFSGDSNTGIYAPAADQVSISAGGTGRATVTGTGLDITGNATVSGNFTVDTNTLVVDAANNRLGIGTATPGYPLSVNGRISYNGAIGEGPDTTLSSSGTTLLHGNSSTWVDQQFYAGGFVQYRLQTSGVFTWYDGAGGTRMTLNGTGLGVGIAPVTSKVHVAFGDSGTAGLREANSLKIENTNTTANNLTGLFLSQAGDAGCGIAAIATSRTGGSRTSDLALYSYSQATSANPIERVRIDSSGNVGIGTATPGGKLEITSNTNGQNRLFLNNPSTGSGAYVSLDFTAGTSNNQILSMGSGYSGSFPYSTGALVIRSNNVNGIVINTSGSSAPITFGINDSTAMTLNGTGLGVGVGPDTNLHVRKDFAGYTTIKVQNNSSLAAGTGASFTLNDGGVDASWFRRQRDGSGNTDIGYKDTLRFRGAITATERTDMLIDTNGNVGIGTTTPAVLLEVSKNSVGEALRLTRSSDLLRSLRFVSSDNVGSGAKWSQHIDSAYGTFGWTSNSVERMVLDSSGNLGLGVTPKAWNAFTVFQNKEFSFLGFNYGQGHVTLNAYYQEPGGVQTWKFMTANGYATRYTHEGGYHKWFSSTTTSGGADSSLTWTSALMTLDASGNLGVGVTTPAHRLNVVRTGDGITAGIAGGTYGIRFDNGGTFSSGMSTIHGVDSTLTGSYQPIMVNGSDVRFGIAGNLKMLLDSSGNLGLGVTPSAWQANWKVLQFANGSSIGNPFNGEGTFVGSNVYRNSSGDYIRLDTGYAAMYMQLSGSHRWHVAGTSNAGSTIPSFSPGSQAMTLDASGRLMVGTASARSNFFNSSVTTQLQVEGDGAASFVRNVNDVYGGVLVLGKIRGTSIVQNNDRVSQISFQGSDGTEFVECANISAEIDGAPGANDMPGRLVFSTTSDGAAAPTERLRITSAGVSQFTGTITCTGNITSGYGTFAAPGFVVGDAQYGLYVDSGNLVYKSAATGLNVWKNTANTVNTMTVDNNGNLVAQGVVTAGSIVRIGTAYTGNNGWINGYFGANILWDGTNWQNYGFGGNNGWAAMVTTGTGGEFQWISASGNGTSNRTYNETQFLAQKKMTLTGGGVLLLGTASVASSETLRVYNATNSRLIVDQASNGLVLGADASGPFFDTTGSNRLAFFVGGTQRMAIDTSGNTILAGPLRAANGTAAAPSISFDSDTNTGIYRIGADTVGISTNGVAAFKVNSNGSFGYTTDVGGAVTQATSRTTGVTLNSPCGGITLVSAAGSTSWQTFTVTNSTVEATDVVRVCQKSGTDLYQIHVTNVSAGSFKVTFATTGGTTTEQPVFNFAVIKATAGNPV